MKENIERNVFLAILACFTFAFIWLLQPFYGVIFWAFTIAVVFSPIYQFLVVKTQKKCGLSAVLTLLICCVAVIGPLVIISTLVIAQAQELAQMVKNDEINPEAYINHLKQSVEQNSTLSRLDINWEEIKTRAKESLQSVGEPLTKGSLMVGKSAMGFVIDFFLMLYLAFFLLRDSRRLQDMLFRVIPLGDKREKRLFERFTTVTRATLKGNLSIALIQGSIGGVVFWALGIQSAFLWGFCMAIAALIPIVGSALVWGPVLLYFLFNANYVDAMIILAMGVFIGSIVDNILRPVLIGRDIKMPDYVVLLSTLGGIALFGITGFIIGPLIAALFFVSWSIFIEDFYDGNSNNDPENKQPNASLK